MNSGQILSLQEYNHSEDVKVRQVFRLVSWASSKSILDTRLEYTPCVDHTRNRDSFDAGGDYSLCSEIYALNFMRDIMDMVNTA